MFNDGGRMKDLRCGNPTCEYCGVTYPMIERHDCVFSHEAKMKILQEKHDSLFSALKLARTTIRDQFAMVALTALIPMKSSSSYGGNPELSLIECDCEVAYQYADKMLKARERTE